MHRFSRSDRKWMDRWGGGFVIATVLALVGAWWLGNWLGGGDASQELPDLPTTTLDSPGVSGPVTTGPLPDLATYPKSLTVYHLQEGAYSTRERAQRRAEELKREGIPAHVSEQGRLHKVIIGAYGSAGAAKTAKAHYQAKIPDLWPVRIEVTGAPASPTALEARTEFINGVAALNAYLHETAAFWDAYTTGSPTSTDALDGYADRLGAVAGQLRTRAADLAVNRLLVLADQAVANSAQISGLVASASTGGGPDYQAAMGGYLSLLDSYKAWIERA